MQIPHPHTYTMQIVGQILRHFFRQSSYQHALVFFYTNTDFLQQVINLIGYRTHFHFRIYQTGRTNQLFYNLLAVLPFIGIWCGTDINSLPGFGFKFVKAKRAVVQCRWQAKAEVHQVFFTRTVTGIHTANLRYRHMGFINKRNKILRKEVQQRVRRRARRSARQWTGIIFYTGAEPYFTEHFHIITGTLLNTLRLD